MKLALLFRFLIISVTALSGSFAFADNISGRRVDLSPGVSFKRLSDGARVNVRDISQVVLQSPQVSNRSVIFPFNLGGDTYYFDQNTAIRMGLTTQGECNQLRRSAGSRNQSDLRQLARAGELVPVSLNNLPGPNGPGWDKRCNNFISTNGRLGPWGVELINASKAVPIQGASAHAAMMLPNLWQAVCPKFSTFSADQRMHFVATFVATKAMDEANCDPNSYANIPGMPNPPGVGFFMLEGQARLRVARDRQAGSGAFCSGGHQGGVQNTLTRTNQFQCMASQMMDLMFKEGRSFCNNGKYWQEAQRMNGDICQTMVKYPGCR